MQFAAELLGCSRAEDTQNSVAAQTRANAHEGSAELSVTTDAGERGQSSAFAPRNSSAGQSGMDEKRVSNQMLRRKLGVTLRFPTYREGLQGIHEGDQTPFD